MELSIYQIDAFASEIFKGNPAAVCPLEEWLSDDEMQSIACENNLSETALFVPTNNGFHIRWFSPTSEVALCGHATLASSFVIFNILNYDNDKIEFESKSGILTVTKNADSFTLDFPAQPPQKCETPIEITNAFEAIPTDCLKSEDYIVVFDDKKDIKNADPDFEQLKKLVLRGVIITAKSNNYDFVARGFFPTLGINEDPVTGSAYTQLAPYWSSKLGKNKFNVKQLSLRGGELVCELKGDRVFITGKAIKYMEGQITI